MAITAGTWNRMSFLPFSDAAWTGLTNPPTLVSVLVKKILDGSSLDTYVVSDGDPFVITFAGGQATLPAAVVDTEGVQTSVDVANTLGQQTSISRDVSGNSLWCDLTTYVVTVYDGANTADINSITT